MKTASQWKEHLVLVYVPDYLIEQIQYNARFELEEKCKELERQRDNYRDQVKISDEGWVFHNKRANDLMEKYNQLEAQLVQRDKEIKRLKSYIVGLQDRSSRLDGGMIDHI